MRIFIRLGLLGVVLAVIVVAVGIERVQSEQYVLEGLATFEGNFMGISTKYATMGDTKNQAIVYVHGMGGVFNEAIYEEYQLFKVLSERYYIVVPDLPGFRRAQIPQNPWTVPNYAAFLREVITELGIVRPIIIGQTSGGIIVIEYATLFPDQIRLMVLGNTPKALGDKEILEFLSTQITGPLHEQLFNSGLAGILREEALRVLSVPEQMLLEDLNGYSAMGESINNLLTYTRDNSELLQITTPTIIVWGAMDSQAPIFWGRRLAELFPNSDIVEYPAGRKALLERPKEVLNLLNEAMKGEVN